MQPGLNLEFARDEKLSLAESLRWAASAGYRKVEAYVYTPICLPINSHLSIETTSAYHHIHASEIDTAELNRTQTQAGVEFSALNAHASLLLPQIGIPYLRSAIETAAALGCPIVMSDEGPVPRAWLSLDRAFDVMCASIESIVPYAQQCGVLFAIELHNSLTAMPKMLQRLLKRFGPEELGVNFDTGNCFLAGNDPAEYLEMAVKRTVHVHLKDIPESLLPLRGQVTGTRVGVAAGDGVVDIPKIISILARNRYDGVISVECDTFDQAKRSIAYLDSLIEVCRAAG